MNRFEFLEFDKVLEIRDKNLQGTSLCTSQRAFYYFGRYVCLHFVNPSVNYFVV
jgi:hypothetical protein